MPTALWLVSSADPNDLNHTGRVSLSDFATTLLPGHDNLAPSSPMSGASAFIVSCGFRLSEVGVSEIRKPQVISHRMVASLRDPTLYLFEWKGGAATAKPFESSIQAA
jgi:hypothetical protein